MLFCFLFIANSSIFSQQTENSSIPGVFDKNEFNLAVNKYLEKISKYNVHGTSETIDVNKRTVTSRSKMYCKQLDVNSLFWFQNLNPNFGQEEKLIVANKDYMFELKRTNKNNWLLYDYVRKNENNSSNGFYRLDARIPHPITCQYAPYWLENMMWLPALINDNEVVFSNIQVGKTDWGEYLQVNFQTNRPDKIRGLQQSKGTIRFDPTNYWIVREFEHQMISNNAIRTVKCTRQFKFIDNFPFLSKFITEEQSTVAPGFIGQATHEWEFSKNDSTEADYRLTAYGLPEPTEFVSGRNWTFLVYLAIGIFFLLVTVLFYRWRSSRNKSI